MPENVQLTRINVYNDRECQIYSISRHIDRQLRHDDRIIKRNIFGHKWVFKVNDYPRKSKKKSWKLHVYVLVTACILVAVFAGVYFTLEKHFKQYDHDSTLDTNNISSQHIETDAKMNINNKHKIANKTNTKILDIDAILVDINEENNRMLEENANISSKVIEEMPICNCTQEEVCLKMAEMSRPSCIRIKDHQDPTGCGGHCIINVERCKVLDSNKTIHQCIRMAHHLNCPKNMFNCGNMCVHISKRCDGIINCLGQADEVNCDCDLGTHFQCGNQTSCLILAKKCDGIVDCWDKTDEKNCSFHDCDAEHELPCTSGQCIKKDAFCDGIIHCIDKSDEPKGCQQ